MEKQIQTLTSEYNHQKNNQNNVATFKTEIHSQQQSQATPSPPITLSGKTWSGKSDEILVK